MNPLWIDECNVPRSNGLCLVLVPEVADTLPHKADRIGVMGVLSEDLLTVVGKPRFDLAQVGVSHKPHFIALMILQCFTPYTMNIRRANSPGFMWRLCTT